MPRWTLSFRNSSYAGEFAETLLHSLYRHDTIAHLSFTGDRISGEETSTLLSYLVGSLPESIQSATFDGVLSGKAVEAMEILMRGGGRREQAGKGDAGGKHVLSGLAIINSPYLNAEVSASTG